MTLTGYSHSLVLFLFCSRTAKDIVSVRVVPTPVGREWIKADVRCLRREVKFGGSEQIFLLDALAPGPQRRLDQFHLRWLLAICAHMDTRTPEQRRRIMQAVKAKDTGPEMAVRRMLYSHGYRYRLHRKDLPGRPDIVFVGKRKAIFVHGCFWHGHDCAKGKLPKSKLNYWQPKIEQNKARDARNIAELEAAGWNVLVVWQCEIADSQALWQRLQEFVDS